MKFRNAIEMGLAGLLLYASTAFGQVNISELYSNMLQYGKKVEVSKEEKKQGRLDDYFFIQAPTEGNPIGVTLLLRRKLNAKDNNIIYAESSIIATLTEFRDDGFTYSYDITDGGYKGGRFGLEWVPTNEFVNADGIADKVTLSGSNKENSYHINNLSLGKNIGQILYEWIVSKFLEENRNKNKR